LGKTRNQLRSRFGTKSASQIFNAAMGRIKLILFFTYFSYFEIKKRFGKFYAVLKQNSHHHKKISLNPTPHLLMLHLMTQFKIRRRPFQTSTPP
jgi:hypothetical protein